MISGDVNQTQYLQNTFMTKADSNNVSRKDTYNAQDNDFKKVLSSKQEESKGTAKSSIDSKESKVLEKDKTEASKPKAVEEIDNKDQPENLEEEKLNKVNTMIQDLILALQLNSTIDEDKLTSLTKELENIINALDTGFAKLNLSTTLDSLKDLIVKLESMSNLEVNANESLNVALKGELEQLSQLVKSLDSSLKLESKASNDTESIDMSKSNNESISSIETTSSNESKSSNDGTSSNGNNTLNTTNTNPLGNTEAKGDLDTKISSDEKDDGKNSESKISLQSKGKVQSDLPFNNKKATDSKTALVKDIDVIDSRNIHVSSTNNIETVEVNKTLATNIPKPDMNIFNQVIEGAKVNISEDASEMILKLKPDNLGKLSMKIVLERGMLVARFDVESQIVKEAIESNLEDLRNALSDKGFEIQEFNVSVNKDSDNQESSFSYFNKRKSKKTLSNDTQVKNNTYISNLLSIDSLSSSINYLG